jgi:hypothetical protein
MKAQDMLPDGQNRIERNGTVIRKGTVGAFLVNVKLWSDAAAEAGQRADAERDIVEALPALRELGLFDVLDVRDDRLRALIDAH